jgi:predicted metal-dependent hydrolase
MLLCGFSMLSFFQNKKEEVLPSWLPEHTIVVSKRKSLALEISVEKGLVIRLPKRLSFTNASSFLQQKKEWILKKFHFIQHKKKECEEKKKQFFFLGKNYINHFYSEQENQMKGACFSFANFEKESEALVAWYTEKAKEYFQTHTTLIAKQMNISFSRIRITSAQRRWGSCSSNGTISFPWRLIMLPEKIIRYVIIHELAHRKEMNHSKNFWSIVHQFCPEYKEQRSWLRKNGNFFVL